MYKSVLLLLFLIGLSSQKPTLVWESFHAAAYPDLARLAHIAGSVEVEFTLSTENAVTIQKSTGHPVLVAAAEEVIKSSRFRCSDCETQRAFAVIFNFTIAEHPCQRTMAPATVTLETIDRVSVIAEPVCTEEIDPVIRSRRARSARCLYLWRCGWAAKP